MTTGRNNSVFSVFEVDFAHAHNAFRHPELLIQIDLAVIVVHMGKADPWHEPPGAEALLGEDQSDLNDLEKCDKECNPRTPPGDGITSPLKIVSGQPHTYIGRMLRATATPTTNRGDKGDL